MPVNGLEDGVIPRVAVNEIFLHVGICCCIENSFADLTSDTFPPDVDLGIVVQFRQYPDLQGADFQFPGVESITHNFELCFPTNHNNIGLLFVLMGCNVVLGYF
jgi:hypothetical protein